MSKAKKYKQMEVIPQILDECRARYGLRTYISLFSGAGVGCYGFKEEKYYCVVGA